VSRTEAKSVLLIDDDRDLAEMLRIALEDQGYSVTVGNNGRDGLRSFYGNKPDLVILDLMMPTMDGWTVCERIRELAETPILILTARAAEEDVTRGLYLGADDYITKPFGVAELLARVSAVLRRSREVARLPSQSLIAVDGRLSIDLLKRRVILNGKPAEVLSPTELRLLSVLVAHAGEVVPFEVLVERVWGDDRSKNSGHLKTYVHYLRAKVEEDPSNPRYITTERGLGYRFRSGE
jgi:two-component system, OmpR family, KDP operon response regulator KdpE